MWEGYRCCGGGAVAGVCAAPLRMAARKTARSQAMKSLMLWVQALTVPDFSTHESMVWNFLPQMALCGLDGGGLVGSSGEGGSGFIFFFWGGGWRGGGGVMRLR